MTIAACYVSSEGVVLGADSTSTMFVPTPDGQSGGNHHLNFAQKVFEIGNGGSLGITMWGMGAVGDLSHRTLIARYADSIEQKPYLSVAEAAVQFAATFWGEYSRRLQAPLARFRELRAKPATEITGEEQQEMYEWQHRLSGGFCLGGHSSSDRQAESYEIIYRPDLTAAPVPLPLNTGSAYFWGCPNIIHRILYGVDDDQFTSILASGKWTGTDQELLDLFMAKRLAQPYDLPLREAIDWVNTIIYATIKAMKFSHYFPVCGGPIEIALISSDRPFRWVKHKSFDEALL